MVMRVGGLATGMDIESIVNKLMQAERTPLNRMEQDRTTLTWKRDAFRDINKALLELDNMMLDMKMSSTYNSKTVTSSQESAVTATGSTSSTNGVYSINVERLATSAMNVSTEKVVIDPNTKLDASQIGEFKFNTFDENEGGMKEHTIEIKDGDTLNDVLKRITDADNNVRAFYDVQSQQVVLETTRTGDYNPGGKEIVFDNSNIFFTNTLMLDPTAETGGTNARFTYNDGLTIETQNNAYDLNGITFQFNNTTEGNARLTVNNDIESSFDSIVKFVGKYNEVIEKMNESQQEERFRDFKPLSDEQKKEMSEDEIEKWEEKAKSAMLRGESSITSGMFSMRQSWYTNVDTGGDVTSLTQIGITTSNRYLDGGKLEIKEEDLRKALQEDPEGVQKLFSNSVVGESRGLVNRLEDTVEETMGRIEERAGNSTHTLENYTLGKRMKDINERITSFEARMVRVETRYWNQFTQMEKAIQQMNSQSSQLFSQFGGGA